MTDIEKMTLDRALYILASCHTRDNDTTGFVISVTNDPSRMVGPHEYVEAWKTVREHLHLQTEPKSAG